MRITYTVSMTGAIRAGHNDHGEREREVDVAHLSPEDREMLAGAVDHRGRVGSVTGKRDSRLVSVVAAEPTPAALLAAIRAARAEAARLDAERAQFEADEIARVEAYEAESLRLRRTKGDPGALRPDYHFYRTLNYAKGREAELTARNSPEWAEWEADLERQNAEHKAAAEAERARAKAEAKAREEAGRAELAVWVRENGSELARLRLAEGYACWVSAAHDDYADAVLARVAAGLPVADEPEGTDGRPVAEDRACPTAPEIKTLRAVRERAAAERAAAEPVAARLVRVRYDRADDCEDDDVPEQQHRTEVEITVTCPDGHEVTSCHLIPAE